MVVEGMKDGELKKEEGKKKKGRSEKKKSEGPQLGKSGNSSNPTTKRGKNPERPPDSNRVG